MRKIRKEIRDLIKNHKRFVEIISISVLIICILIPIIIHFFSPRINSELTADGVLEYIAGMFSAISTFLLSLYAIVQTRKANRMTEKALDIEWNNYKLQLRPFINVSDYQFKKITSDKILTDYNDTEKVFINIDKWDKKSDVYGISLGIINTTDSILSFNLGLINTDGESWNCGYINRNIRKMFNILLPNASKELVLFANKDFFERNCNSKVQLQFCLKNKFSEKYQETIDMECLNIEFIENDIMNGYLFFVDFHIYKMKNGKPVEEKL